MNSNSIQFSEPLDIPFSEAENIHFILGCVVGSNFSNQKIARLFQEWDNRMRNIDKFYCIGIDEMRFMALAWKYRLTGVKNPGYIENGEFFPDFTNPSDIHLFIFD